MEVYLEKEFLSRHIMYAIRISRVQELNLDRTFDYFKRMTTVPGKGPDPRYIPSLLFSEEGLNGTHHIHGVVAFDNSRIPEKPEEYLRNIIKEMYPDAKGNRCLYVKRSQEPKQLMKYTLKEGNYRYMGFRKSLINRMVLCSSKKENLKQKVRENEERLLSSEISYEKFVEEHLLIMVSHNQNIYINHVKSYFNKMQLKSGDISVRMFIEKYFLDN